MVSLEATPPPPKPTLYTHHVMLSQEVCLEAASPQLPDLYGGRRSSYQLSEASLPFSDTVIYLVYLPSPQHAISDTVVA